jgi:hypothetical protein
MPYGNRTKFHRKCPTCKKQFKVAFWELKTKKTCSFECSKIYKKTLPIPEERKIKTGLALKGKYLKEKSSQWKGDNASYESQHEWVRKEYIRIHGKLPTHCEHCGQEKNRLEASNISGQYKRTLSDYQFICNKCHYKYDHSRC